MANPIRARRLWEGSGAPLTHRSAGFQGAQSLSNPNSSNQFNISSGTSLATVAFWFKMDQFTAGVYQKPFNVGDPASAAVDQWVVQINGGQNIESVYSNGSSYSLVSQVGLTITLGKWYLVFAGPGGGTTIYISLYDQSGVMPGGSTGATGPINQPTHQPLTIGSAKGLVTPFFGEIDSFGLWPSRLLTGPEMTAIWNNGKAIDFAQLPASALTGLALWSNLDSRGNATTWVDDSGGGNPLTATGAVLSQAGAGF